MPIVSILLSTYKSERFLSVWLDSLTRQSLWSNAELIICANDPNPGEKNTLTSFVNQWPGQVTLMFVARENLYASWNRCIDAAGGKYLAIGNVDDIRTADGLQLQVEALEQQQEALFCYGPFMIVNQFPSENGYYIPLKEFDQLEFTRSMLLGPFFVWRNTNNPAVKYFDEQFKSGGDFEFAIRLAIHGRGVGLDSSLGYYLDEGTGLSTGNELQPIERTVIELRYGIFDKIDIRYLDRAMQYSIQSLNQRGKWVSINQFVPDYEKFIKERYQQFLFPGAKDSAARKRVKPKLTLLTEPVPNIVTSRQTRAGHYAVTRSLLEGLTVIGASYNFNPNLISELGETVVVLSGVDALAQAIEWKRKGIIKRLLAGPNLMVRANEYYGIMARPEVDICIVPSDWVRIAYEEDAPNLIGRIKVWYAGIDERYWQPPQDPQRGKEVVVYWKTEPEEFCCAVEKKLQDYGWHPIRITYGQYKPEEYKQALARSAFSVFISISESQGLAQVEAWAMDVPTVVWNKQILKKHYQEAEYYSVVSACPYLNPLVGVDWVEIEELEKFLSNAEESLQRFKPRQWVLEHMTDTHSAKRLLQIIE